MMLLLHASLLLFFACFVVWTIDFDWLTTATETNKLATDNLPGCFSLSGVEN